MIWLQILCAAFAGAFSALAFHAADHFTTDFPKNWFHGNLRKEFGGSAVMGFIFGGVCALFSGLFVFGFGWTGSVVVGLIAPLAFFASLNAGMFFDVIARVVGAGIAHIIPIR